MMINYQGVQYDCDPDLSFKDFTGHDLRDRNDIDFTDKIVYASCFSQETPETKIFTTLSGATLIKCNLDNVQIPDGATIIDCSQKRFKIQNDLRDWEVDEQNNPVRVINENFWSKGIAASVLSAVVEKYSVNPADIPAQKLTSITQITKVP